ncbi:MAG: chemotaxis protein CheX [Clostridia bacterium]|jgi:chemotaxis protein CheX
MTESIYTPFYLATSEVFKLLLDLEVKAGSPELLHHIADEEDKVNIVIGITGDIEGEILYRFPKETTLEMVKIMSGMDFPEVDSFVTSALGEIANIISGNAVTGLSKRRMTCDISPPRVIVGGGETLDTQSTIPIIALKVQTAIGEVKLNMQLQEKK